MTAIASQLWERIVPPAEHQSTLAADEALHSANAGVVVAKAGQLRSEFRSQGRMFAREVAKHVNTRQPGKATAFVYEETFGVEDRLHFLIHLASLETYYDMVEMGDRDRAYRQSLQEERVQADDGGGAWDRLFIDGSLCSTVLLPATAAREQTARHDEELLHSGNAGIVIHRTAQVAYGHRARAHELATLTADTVNKELTGEATALLYTEAFGAVDRSHWLICLRDLTVYRRLLEVSGPDEADWGTAFVAGSIRDVSLTPHHWGLYGTDKR